ncbi:hypothetical protein KAFR_0F04260 [Kazachstania africana CBS 2517]|uniref:Uncharacterized protein n=1 Tax=Kazachstania africana (strain ATCC 22294 / BCRC 22015 / CBS 2517 / CECT 1963 / NBRC 1671 / NRRL Y-8276) TaxID=1071382 RepID=H2AXC1_KAZAF|nr:hypothetical protein KAFR_0F04260 [Kazachstania africana CBS 2517]CCF59021.1 hypothetical protein KAFR_0F04260 [Kazachstania africana CBS 2517]
MITPTPVHDSVKEFQDKSIDENLDYALLKHEKSHLQRKLTEQRYFYKQLQVLYSQVEKTKNYQEFIDVLTNLKPLLREIFTLEGQQRRSSKFSTDIDIDWTKYGIDVLEYVSANDQLLAMYTEGLLL